MIDTHTLTTLSATRFSPLPLGAVKFSDSFWAPRIRTNRERTLRYIYVQLQAAGVIDCLDVREPGPLRHANHHGDSNVAMYADSDVAKWLEGACLSLQTHPDPDLRALVDGVVDRFVVMQAPDGYLNSYFLGRGPERRFTNERDWHELYNAGHLVEAAIAHYQATGEKRLLQAVSRYLDLIASVYGPTEGQKRGYPGHEELELALIKLFRITNERRWLDLARFFVSERGQTPHFFIAEAEARGEGDHTYFDLAYYQAHRPVREQSEVVGHAVRAMYLYSAMADLALEDGDSGLQHACKALWRDLTSARLYVTGGLGPSATNEGFTTRYDLPNDTAYAETCAGVGLAMWARRLLALDLNGEYTDAMERALYNNVLAGVALDGEHFFYDNVLASDGRKHRFSWHPCPCCPTNLARLLPSLGEYAYAYAQRPEGHVVVVHLYVHGAARVPLAVQTLELVVDTAYPWDGRVCVRLTLDDPEVFTLALRVPGWCQSAQIAVNGETVNLAEHVRRGYVYVSREWRDGDEITLELPMPVEFVRAHPNVTADTGRVALQRGPLVYCVEGTDHDVPLHLLVLQHCDRLSARFDPTLLGGTTVLEGNVLAADLNAWENNLYLYDPPPLSSVRLCAVPYALWDNRDAGEMRVWLPLSAEHKEVLT